MPVDWKRYPSNWSRVRRAIMRRARGRCEWCGAENHKPHPVTGSRVVLTTAHLGEPFAVLCAFAGRDPDGCEFKLRKSPPKTQPPPQPPTP